MYLSVDFGGSTFDVIAWKGQKPFQISSFERVGLPEEKSTTLLQMIDNEMLAQQQHIYITGGKSSFFPSKISGVPVKKIHEIEAIGRGGSYLLRHDRKLKKYQQNQSFLVVSMGTGTCMVKVNKRKNGDIHSIHLGGTGIGGGTFLALCKLLLHQTDIHQIQKMLAKGDSRNVDLSVGDIIGKSLGLNSASITASNLGKISRKTTFSSADMAAGIVNLIGQTIGSTAVFAALASNCRLIVLTGKLAKMKEIVKVIAFVGRIHKVEVVVPDNAAFVSAFGAGSLGLSK